MQAAAAYLAARMACCSVAQAITYIEYPLDRDGRPGWVCCAKALWAAEQALGEQAEPLQKALAARLSACCQPVGAGLSCARTWARLSLLRQACRAGWGWAWLQTRECRCQLLPVLASEPKLLPWISQHCPSHPRASVC